MINRTYIRLFIGTVLLTVASLVLYYASQSRKPLAHPEAPLELTSQLDEINQQDGSDEITSSDHFERRKDKYKFGQEPVDIKLPVTKKAPKKEKPADTDLPAEKLSAEEPKKPAAQKPLEAAKPKTEKSKTQPESSGKLEFSAEEKKALEETSLRLQEEMIKNMSHEEKQEYANFQKEFTKMLESDEFKKQVADLEEKMQKDPKLRKEIEDFNREFIGSLAKLGEEMDKQKSTTTTA